MNLWPYGDFLPLVHSAKKEILFRAQDILEGSMAQIQVFINIFLFSFTFT